MVRQRLSTALAGSALVLGAMVLVAAACSITVTHESSGQYHTTPQAGDAGFDDFVADPPSPTTSTPNAYRGTHKAQAHYQDGGNPSTAHAYGELSTGRMDPDNDGVYGAAVYLPPGTVAGERPAQRGTIDLMRWRDDESGSWGGIRIGEDHRGHLVDSSGSDVKPGSEFAFQEGCWNWIVVHQKLRSAAGDGPLSEVYVNGKRMISSTNVNTSSSITGGVDRVQFGLVELGTHPSQETGDLDVFVDDPFIGTDNNPLNRQMVKQSLAPLCHPLPNVLFIVTDDQRADEMLGATNPIGDLVMPRTRSLFRNGAGNTGGTEFSNTYVTTPLCCPSRGSILTGEYAHNHGKRSNADAEIADLAPKLRFSIQRYLHDWWGYRTALFGKFLNGWVQSYDTRFPDNPPPPTYFDEYAMMDGQYRSGGSVMRTCQASPPNSFSCFETDPPETLPPDPSSPYPEPGRAVEIADYTLPYIKQRMQGFLDAQNAPDKDAQPWFLYVAPFAPHEEGPRWGPNAWCKMTDGSDAAIANRSRESISDPQIGDPLARPQFHEADRSDKPNYIQTWSDSRTIYEPGIGTPNNCDTRYSGLREQQIRVAAEVDKLVDDVFAKLDATGETTDTLAFYISDNGYMWREHSPGATGAPNECFADIYHQGTAGAALPCGPSSKGLPYRQSINVPLFARWPNRPASWSTLLAPGQTDNRLAANIDLAPTVLDAVGGLSLPASQFDRPMDGRSLRSPVRAKLLTEGWSVANIPDWASVVWPNGNQYIRSDDNEPETPGDQPFDEYYTDLIQNNNVFGTTPPPLAPGELGNLRTCSGSNLPAFSDTANPCP